MKYINGRYSWWGELKGPHKDLANWHRLVGVRHDASCSVEVLGLRRDKRVKWPEDRSRKSGLEVG